MWLLPYRSFTIESPLEPSAARARLNDAIQPTRWFRSSPATAPFEGVLDGTRFQLQRVIRYRNSFLPVVKGVLQPAPTSPRSSTRRAPSCIDGPAALCQ
jgi:hypothetical protein